MGLVLVRFGGRRPSNSQTHQYRGARVHYQLHWSSGNDNVITILAVVENERLLKVKCHLKQCFPTRGAGTSGGTQRLDRGYLGFIEIHLKKAAIIMYYCYYLSIRET